MAIALADQDFRPFLRSTDATERIVEVLVAREVSEQRAEHEREQRQHLAAEVGSHVNRAVVPAVNAALTAIGRAMRG